MNHPDKTYITTHSIKQAKYRFDWSADELMEYATTAWTEGMEIPDELKHIYFNRITDSKPDTRLMFYDDIVFIFGTQYYMPRLITLLLSRDGHSKLSKKNYDKNYIR